MSESDLTFDRYARKHVAPDELRELLTRTGDLVLADADADGVPGLRRHTGEYLAALFVRVDEGEAGAAKMSRLLGAAGPPTVQLRPLLRCVTGEVTGMHYDDPGKMGAEPQSIDRDFGGGCGYLASPANAAMSRYTTLVVYGHLYAAYTALLAPDQA